MVAYQVYTTRDKGFTENLENSIRNLHSLEDTDHLVISDLNLLERQARTTLDKTDLTSSVKFVSVTIAEVRITLLGIVV